jgi:hypothetical protein
MDSVTHTPTTAGRDRREFLAGMTALAGAAGLEAFPKRDVFLSRG